jgi:hypothetical protein
MIDKMYVYNEEEIVKQQLTPPFRTTLILRNKKTDIITVAHTIKIV